MNDCFSSSSNQGHFVPISLHSSQPSPRSTPPPPNMLQGNQEGGDEATGVLHPSLGVERRPYTLAKHRTTTITKAVPCTFMFYSHPLSVLFLRQLESSMICRGKQISFPLPTRLLGLLSIQKFQRHSCSSRPPLPPFYYISKQ